MLKVKENEIQELVTKDSDKIIIIFRFLCSAHELNTSPSNPEMVDSITIQPNKLEGEPYKQRAVADEDLSLQRMPLDLLVPCIGYVSRPIEGEVFDQTAKVIPNANGCVLTEPGAKLYQVGKYAAGWVKTGANGGLDATYRSSVETFNNVRVHLINDQLPLKIDPLPALKTKKEELFHFTTSFEDWIKINEIEEQRGKEQGRVRAKINNNEEIESLLSFYCNDSIISPKNLT